jgi:hypothetical protein
METTGFGLNFYRNEGPSYHSFVSFGSSMDKISTWWSDLFEMMRVAVKIELKTQDRRLKITIVISQLVPVKVITRQPAK